MNNRGQTLVLFILVLPIILLIFVLLIDVAYKQSQNQKVTNDVNLAIHHYFKNKTLESLTEIEKNLKHYNIKIKHSDNSLTLIIEYQQKSLLNKTEKVTMIYTGTSIKNQVVIRKGF